MLDGEAGALAGLCDSRGPSVVGYCSCVCGPERAVEAAAAAFAAFRAGAVRAADPLSIDPEALLLGRTRAAAAQRAPKPASSLVFGEIPCSQIPALLAERATGSISAADEDRLRQHLARCAACRGAQGVQEEAERTYFHPTADAVDPVSRLEIIDALRRAVPPPMRTGRTQVSPNGDRPGSASSPEITQAAVGRAQPRIPQPLPRTAAVTGSNLTSTPVGQPQAAGPSGTPRAEPSTGAGAPVAVEVLRRSTIAGGVVVAPESPGSPSPAGQPATGAAPAEDRGAPGGGRAVEWDSPTGVMSAVDLAAAAGHQPGVDFAGQPGGADPSVWADAGGPVRTDPTGLVDAGAPATDPGGRSSGQSGRRRAIAAPFATDGVSRVTVPRVLGPVAVLVVGLVVALFVAGVFNSGGARAPSASSVSGGQADPSTSGPAGGTQTSGSSSIGGASTGGGAVTGSGSTAASAGATTAASRAAARKRAAAVARRLRAAGGTGAAKTGPSRPATSGKRSSPTRATTGAGVASPTTGSRTSGPAAGTPGSQTRSPTGGAPAANPTKPSSTSRAPAKPTTSRPVTVHELGPGAGSARPVTGVPATGATGYQPG